MLHFIHQIDSNCVCLLFGSKQAVSSRVLFLFFVFTEKICLLLWQRTTQWEEWRLNQNRRVWAGRSQKRATPFTKWSYDPLLIHNNDNHLFDKDAWNWIPFPRVIDCCPRVSHLAPGSWMMHKSFPLIHFSQKFPLGWWISLAAWLSPFTSATLET